MRNDQTRCTTQTPHRPADLADRFAIAALGSLLIWAIMAGLSVMAFDEGQSPGAWAFVLTVWAYPLFPLLMTIGAWVAFAFRKNRLAAILSGLTFAPPVLLYLFVWIANSYWAIMRQVR